MLDFNSDAQAIYKAFEVWVILLLSFIEWCIHCFCISTHDKGKYVKKNSMWQQNSHHLCLVKGVAFQLVTST